MNPSPRTRLAPLDLWIWLCVALNAGGWLLSAFGALNRTGYIAVVILSALVAAAWWKATRPVFHTGIRCRRFRRMFPLAFGILAAMAILGGFLHGPANYDALAYRVPRVLHWLAEGKWHWIHTDFQRLNTRGNGIEWLSAPLILFTGTDRFLFLINAVSFLLLPGICFRLLSHLGVRKKVAWHWMWIFPTGYCYLLQAGSIANDMFGSVLAFAAVDYALRATRTRSASLASMAVLAAALATSVKAFNLLLFIPWALAMLPNITPMLRRPLLTFPLALLAILVSIVPTSVVNHQYSGDWKGLKAEPVKLAAGSPGFHLAINFILIPLHHLNPPVNPLAGTWNKWTAKTIPEAWQEKLNAHFETSVVTFKLGEMQMEESTGLGFGITLLILSILIARHRRVRSPTSLREPLALLRACNLVPIGAALATVYFLTQSGLGCPARYLSPFYLMLIAPILRLPRASELLTQKWWHALVLLCFAMAAALLVLTPPRPLWPANTVLGMMGAENSDSALVKRVHTVYSVYGERSDGFAPAKQALPPGLDVLGLVTFDDPETSLWKPFGSTRIQHVTRRDDAASLRSRGIQYVLVSEYTLKSQRKFTLDEWLARFDSEIVTSLELPLRAGRGPTPWHIVRVRPHEAR
jgi:hypothetical protein